MKTLKNKINKSIPFLYLNTPLFMANYVHKLDLYTRN